jgi:hypothetical protein
MEIYAASSFPPVTPAMPLPTIGYIPKILPVSGIVRVLVIAVAFPDVNPKLSISQVKKYWFGTLSAYYHEISFGKLTIQGDVYGWYTLPYSESHYGRDCRSINDADCSGTNQSWHIAEDAVGLAEKDVNFNNYDYYVFIHSGSGQETSQMNNDIWSVTYFGASVTTHSKIITRFNVVPEVETAPNVPNGVWCVEFAHNLGVPDLYNTTNGPNNGKSVLGPWELMDKGSWNGDPPGSLPAHMTAWPKIQLGFISGSMLATVEPGNVSTFTVDPTEIVSSNVHAIKIPLSSSQYYLVEVRTHTGFDAALPNAGVLITYVNETLPVSIVRVINGDPSVSDLDDAVWHVGQTFTDIKNNLTVSVSGMVGASYQVIVKRSVNRPVTFAVNLQTATHIMIAGVSLTVEIVSNATAQEKGLSGRISLPNDEGMLFVFDHEAYWSFWMVDMRFPLDIIWFNSKGQVVWMEPNLPPCTPSDCPVITPDAQAMYVLEVNAGFVAAHHIVLGTTFVFLRN